MNNGKLCQGDLRKSQRFAISKPSSPTYSLAGFGAPIKGMVLSIGPELSWFYLFLKSSRVAVQNATLAWTIAERNGIVTDRQFPYEFSLPLETPTDRLRCSVSNKTADSETIVVSDGSFHEAGK